MNPQMNSELPPVYHGGPESGQQGEQLPSAVEQHAEIQQARARELGASQPGGPQQQAAQVPPPMPQPVAPPSLGQPPAQSPQIADDIDLIEKEWVEKAKAIVEQTKHDPRAQTKEMSKFKAEYLKRRFNQDLKLEEG